MRSRESLNMRIEILSRTHFPCRLVFFMPHTALLALLDGMILESQDKYAR
jgi:hypothetical protein